MTTIGSGITPLLRNFSVRLTPKYLSNLNYSILFSNTLNNSPKFSHCANNVCSLHPCILKRNLLDKRGQNDVWQHKRGYSMRLQLSEYGIIWRRPPQIPSWMPEKSGDLVPFEEVDVTKPVLAFLPVEKELAQADERAQRLLSIEFSNDAELLKMAKYKMKRKIQQHQFDEDSIEVKIALATVEIRFLQQIVPLISPVRKNLRKRVRLQEMVDKRKKMLKILRRLDYKRFEWLLEELNIIYRPFPRLWQKPTRRDSLRKLVELHCEHLKNEKLEKYRLHLEAMKKPLLAEKRETLKWIAETERKLGVPVTVEIPKNDDEVTAGLPQLEGTTSSQSGDEKPLS